jgi:hypothetical protein
VTSPAARGREAVLAYSGGTLDRASDQRADPGFLDATLAAAGSRLIPMWRDQCIVSGEPAVPVMLAAAEAGTVLEETGVPVDQVTYMASQGWPFPSGLMVGFRATAAADTVTIDGQEVLQARWFTRAELLEHAAAGGRLGRPDSIDRYLLRSWLAESA